MRRRRRRKNPALYLYKTIQKNPRRAAAATGEGSHPRVEIFSVNRGARPGPLFNDLIAISIV